MIDEKKKAVIDYINSADEGNLCVMAALTLATISLKYKGSHNKFKVYDSMQTYECSILFLPPVVGKGNFSVSEIQSTTPSAETIKSLYSEWLKPDKKGSK